MGGAPSGIVTLNRNRNRKSICPLQSDPYPRGETNLIPQPYPAMRPDMQQSHLEPGDIELLLDGDEGFAVFPLRKHIAECAACQAELDEARAVTEMLERLPHTAPSPGFADAVMRQVSVIEPWHVTLTETARRFIPRPGPWRVLAGAGAGGAALTLSALAVWVSMRLDMAMYAGQLGWSRVESAMTSSASSLVASAFGEPALDAVRQGGLPAIVLGLSALAGVMAGATIGLRGLIAAHRRGN